MFVWLFGQIDGSYYSIFNHPFSHLFIFFAKHGSGHKVMNGCLDGYMYVYITEK